VWLIRKKLQDVKDIFITFLGDYRYKAFGVWSVFLVYVVADLGGGNTATLKEKGRNEIHKGKSEMARN